MRPWHIPEEEISFATRTGFLSKPIWEAFFSEGSRSWKVRKWQYFTARKIFLPHSSRLARDVLVPNPEHPLVVSSSGKAIVKPPFAFQIEHDETVARLVLELERQGLLESYVFEPEMKAEELSQGRVPSKLDFAKYPDAVIALRGQPVASKIALEIELSRKSPKRYRELLQASLNRKDVGAILFLARQKAIFEGLRSAMREIRYPDWERPIGFCNLDEWLRNPSTAAIHFSDRVTRLTEMKTAKVSNPSTPCAS